MVESVGRTIKQIPCSDWLPERARRTYLASWDFPCWEKNSISFCHKMNTLLKQTEVKWIAEYWPSSFLNFNVFDFDFVLVNKKKRE